MIILDTNVISEAARPVMDVRVRQWFAGQPMTSMYATAISLAEVTFGVESMPEGRRKSVLREDMERIFDRYLKGRILPFDELAGRAYGHIAAAARARGRSILIADGRIAAIARARGFAVATRDTSPFEAAGIPVVNPWNM